MTLNSPIFFVNGCNTIGYSWGFNKMQNKNDYNKKEEITTYYSKLVNHNIISYNIFCGNYLSQKN